MLYESSRLLRELGTSPLGDFDEVAKGSLDFGPATSLETAYSA
jgi:hypothetical protein